LSEDLRLDYKLSKITLGVNGYVAWLHSEGDQASFETINAQGRVEKYYNTVPRYVLFHAIYRFHATKKGKK